MTRVGCIIQARMGSSRLPGKVLMPLGGKPVILHVLERCSRIDGVDHVVLATTEEAADGPLVEAASKAGYSTFMGDEHDVLSRYAAVARAQDYDVIMRVTGDCPLFDPVLAGSFLKTFLVRKADFAILRGWPHGLDCELLTRQVLEDVDKAATAPADREHVTLWVKNQKSYNVFALEAPDAGLMRERWVLDYPEDYEFLCRVFETAGPAIRAFGWRDILALLEDNPTIRDLNRAAVDAWHQANTGLDGQPLDARFGRVLLN